MTCNMQQNKSDKIDSIDKFIDELAKYMNKDMIPSVKHIENKYGYYICLKNEAFPDTNFLISVYKFDGSGIKVVSRNKYKNLIENFLKEYKIHKFSIDNYEGCFEININLDL